MVLILIMLFIATANVVGCVLIKNGESKSSWESQRGAGFLLRWRAAYFFTTSITKQPISTYRNLPMAPTNCTSSKSENQIGPSVQPTPVLFSKAMGKPSQRAASTLPTTAKTLVLKTGKLYGAATTHQPPYSAKSKATIATTSAWVGKLKSSS